MEGGVVLVGEAVREMGEGEGKGRGHLNRE